MTKQEREEIRIEKMIRRDFLRTAQLLMKSKGKKVAQKNIVPLESGYTMLKNTVIHDRLLFSIDGIEYQWDKSFGWLS